MKTIKWKCPNCWTEYEIDAKFESILKSKTDCKFCVRKDPNVPTTAEMDGLLTQEDMRNRYEIVRQCVNCGRWTQMTHKELGDPSTPCTGIVNGKPYVDGRGKVIEGCGQINYDTDSSGTKSLRTYKPEIDNKRKVKAKKKK